MERSQVRVPQQVRMPQQVRVSQQERVPQQVSVSQQARLPQSCPIEKPLDHFPYMRCFKGPCQNGILLLADRKRTSVGPFAYSQNYPVKRNVPFGNQRPEYHIVNLQTPPSLLLLRADPQIYHTQFPVSWTPIVKNLSQVIQCVWGSGGG